MLHRLKLSTEEVQLNVIHRAVGAITETDVTLASASNAIIIGFQVRPVPNARKAAEKEQIDIRLYSVIYKATEEIKAARLEFKSFSLLHLFCLTTKDPKKS